MHNNIVEYLYKSPRKNPLKEGFTTKGIREADEDDEELDLDTADEPESDEDLDSGDEEAPEFDDDLPMDNPSSSSRRAPSFNDEEEDNGDASEEPKEVEPPKDSTPKKTDNNPLDNIYANSYVIGDEVILDVNIGEKPIKGYIEGYDPEGFYRVKWYNGTVSNGITDIFLNARVSGVDESKCLCGSSNFITEGKYLICDSCGRHIRELKKSEKIRSIHTPVSTSMKEKSLSDAIKYALKNRY